jgi:Flp pilus assembly protein TadG
MRKRTTRNERRGAVALECALVLPIFILCIFGIIEMGRLIMVHQILTNGAREGARRAVVPGATDNDVYATIDNYLANMTISGHTRTISPSLSTARSHDALTVTVSVPYNQVQWGIMNWMSGDTQLATTVVMRKE